MSSSSRGAALAVELAMVAAVVLLLGTAVGFVAALAPDPLNLLSLPGLALVAVSARLLATAAWPRTLATRALRAAR